MSEKFPNAPNPNYNDCSICDLKRINEKLFKMNDELLAMNQKIFNSYYNLLNTQVELIEKIKK